MVFLLLKRKVLKEEGLAWHMIDVFYYDNGVKKGDVKELSSLKEFPLWVDVTAITKKEAELLGKEFDLHPLTQEDLASASTRIKVEAFANYLFCVFYAIEKSKTIKLIDMDFVIGNTFIITNHVKELHSFKELKMDEEKLGQLFLKGSEFVFHSLLNEEVEYYLPILERLDDELEQVEEELTKKPKQVLLRKVLDLKHELSQIRKIAFTHREKVSFLVRNEYKFISKEGVLYFRDVYDHAIRVSDKVDNSREMVSNAFDLYMSSVSNNTNEVMKVLSIFATIALPLTVISSIYGTNFTVLPGSGNPLGFWLMIGFMFFFCVGFVIYFKKRGWY